MTSFRTAAADVRDVLIDDAERARLLVAHGAAAEGFTLTGAKTHYAPDLDVEPTHMDLDLRVDIAQKELAGHVTIDVVGRAGAQKLVLDAVELLDVKVAAGSGARELVWSYDGERITIDWSEPFHDAETRSVRIDYRVAEPLTGLIFSGPTAREPGRGRMVASDHETERARYWLPCVDHLSVRTTLAIHLRVDAALTVLATGKESGIDKHDDGTKTVHFYLEQRCPSYLLAFCVGELVRVDLGDCDGVPLAVFGPEGTVASDLARNFAPTFGMMKWLTSKLDAPFPYPKYFQFLAPRIGGAMENISLTSWDTYFGFDKATHAERGAMLDLVNLHEMAHSYFGDLIACRDFSQVWLKESWAVYMESAWTEDTYGRDAMMSQLLDEEHLYMGEADDRYARPIVTREMDSSWSMFDMHLYPGGAVRLHALRVALGDDVFWRGVRAYVRRFSDQRVETEDFRRTMEEVSGKSLARFFDQWFYRAGYPSLKVSFAHDKRSKQGTFTIEQTQDKKADQGLFHLPFVVLIETAVGRWERHEVSLERKRHQLTVALTDAPTGVAFDPAMAFPGKISFDPGVPMLERAALAAPSVRSRAHAVKQLGAQGKRASVNALRAAGRSEKSWAVRNEIARALGRIASRDALDALGELWRAETNARTRLAMADVLADFADESVAELAREALRRDGANALGPSTRAAVLGVLGRQRDPQDAALIEADLDSDAHFGLVRRGAWSALGQLRDREVTQRMLERVEHGAITELDEPQVRGLAYRAVASAARFEERDLRERALAVLTRAARDEDDVMARLAVGGAIATLGERGRDVVTSLRNRVPHQDVPKVRRSELALRRSRDGATDGKALAKQVDELAEKLRQVMQQVDKLEAKASLSLPVREGGATKKQPQRKGTASKKKASKKVTAAKNAKPAKRAKRVAKKTTSTKKASKTTSSRAKKAPKKMVTRRNVRNKN